MRLEHFLATDHLSDAAVLDLLDHASRIKRDDPRGGLEGKTLGAVFFNPSLRTRASFEVGMFRHGGHMLNLEPGKGVWAFETRRGIVMDDDKAEHVAEAAAVLGRYCDALGVRAFPAAPTWEEARRDEVIHAFAAHAGVPVINLESARRHPCQGLADAMTIRERLGRGTQGKRFVLSWAWHPKALPTAVPNSAAIAAARLGMDVVVARPPGFDLDPEDSATIAEIARRNGGSFSSHDDLDESLEDADIVYAKSWGSLEAFGQPDEEARLREPHRSWIINEERMLSTREGAGAFLHCLPVRRNVVVSDGVLEGPWSRVVDQAENRLHVQRAVLLALMKGRLR